MRRVTPPPLQPTLPVASRSSPACRLEPLWTGESIGKLSSDWDDPKAKARLEACPARERGGAGTVPTIAGACVCRGESTDGEDGADGC